MLSALLNTNNYDVLYIFRLHLTLWATMLLLVQYFTLTVLVIAHGIVFCTYISLLMIH